jgi:RecB family endonuclease NucS
MEDLSMDKYLAFRKLMDFVSDEYEVVDADMNNYAGDINIIGKDETGATITIRVRIQEGENDGN